jgi:membrane-associated phospholipid phosphatase
MRLSKFISFVCHPALMPTYAFLLAVNFVPIFSDFMHDQQKVHLLRMVFIFTFLLPILGVLLLKKMKIISTYHMENRNERKAPLFIAIISYYILLQFFYQMNTYVLFNKLLIGALLILILALFISKFWKISLHMLAIGGVTGAFLALHYLFGGNLYLVLLLLCCSGLVAYARINENAHTLNQVYAGFLVGAFIEFLIFYC